MRVIQHDGDPGLVVHVIGRIDTWQLTEGLPLLRLYLQIDDIELNNAYLGSGLSVYTISLTNKEEKKQSHKEILQALSTLEYVSFVEEIK